MKRSQILLAVLAAVLVIAIFYVLLFQPAREELAALEVDIATEQDVQRELAAEIDRLRLVRDEAPEVEARLAAAEAIVPRDEALPAALRQLQLAADESDVVMLAVTMAPPAAVDEAEPGLSSIEISLQLDGEYFKIVDFLRRVEDPMITPRGLEWLNLTVARADDYPTLSVTLTGRIFALLPAPPPPADASDETATGDATPEGDEDADVDVDVDVDADAEEDVVEDAEDETEVES